MAFADLDSVLHKLGKRGFRLTTVQPAMCPKCNEQSLGSYAIAGKIGGRDIELCHGCGFARSWRSAAGLEERTEDPKFDLTEFLK